MPSIDVQITIVDERDGFYHLIGSPLALADESYASKCWVKYDDIPALQDPQINILHGSVTALDCAAKKATIAAHGTAEPSQLEYDYAIIASGLRRVWPVVPQSLRRKQFLFEAGDHIRAMNNSSHGVVVVGGGAVGIEMAAELKLISPNVPVTLVHSREKLLSAELLPDEAKDKALELLWETGVDVKMGLRVKETREVVVDGVKLSEMELSDGSKMLASHVVMAVSRSVPSTSFLPAEAVDKEGYVMANTNMSLKGNFPNADRHFGVGDVVAWSGIKRAGGAMHSGHHAGHNIYQLILGEKMGESHAIKFQEIEVDVPPMMGLAVGKKAMAYDPTSGVTSGEDVMYAYFQDDLGFKICWNWMRLGGYDGAKLV